MLVVNVPMMKTVGPTTNRKNPSTAAAIALALERYLMPFSTPETAESTKEAARAKLAARFAELDRLLADRPFLTGGRFTVADAYAFTIVNWSNFLGIDLGPYPNLVAFMGRVAERPRAREALQAEGLLKRQAAA